MAKQRSILAAFLIATGSLLAIAGCSTRPNPTPSTATEPLETRRFGDEIVIAGRHVRTGTPVVTWRDPGGFDAASAVVDGKPSYDDRYADESARYHAAVTTRPALADARNWDSPTTRPLTTAQLDQVRDGEWPIDLLRARVDQFVLHYDVAGTSRQCFKTLQARGLSVHFMLDLDGTIYQTLDLQHRAWHATKANGRSIGIEIANVGAYAVGESAPLLEAWYRTDGAGRTSINIPQRLGGLADQRTQPSVLRPARDGLVVGNIRSTALRQYDFTPQQYAALIKLTAALCDQFPLIKCDYPRDPAGRPLMRTLTDREFNLFGGVLGHYHVQSNKADPGPAFQWEYVISEAQKELAARRPSVVMLKH